MKTRKKRPWVFWPVLFMAALHPTEAMAMVVEMARKGSLEVTVPWYFILMALGFGLIDLKHRAMEAWKRFKKWKSGRKGPR